MTKDYIGTKQVTAWPQLGGPKIRVCGHSCHEDGEHCNGYCTGKAAHPPKLEQQQGYAVKYEDGYISWSPKDVFEAAYLPIGNIGHLPAHQQRVVAEKAQLDDKLLKLRKFISQDLFKTLPDIERELLTTQAGAMTEYSDILAQRIAFFGGEQ